ncbi:VQ motif-containing protein 18-like [Nymphaea colorata]|nr:VQ motif-containing protein 18-like [Nymphaea colorata]
MEDDLTDGGGALERRSKPCSTIIATRKGSHSIAKQAAAAKFSPSSPTVRIIHVVPPEIIKTDPCNFRALVQKLTGKPIGRSRWTRHRATGKQQIPARSETTAAAGREVLSPAAPDLKQDEHDSSTKSTANPSLFFNSLGDLDSIFADISQTASSDHTSQSSPLLPLDTNNHHAF